MTGWILFVGFVSFFVGVFVGLVIGLYLYSKGMAKMIEEGTLAYTYKKEAQQ